jgi:flagellar biogenesis protein FliO
MEIFQHVLVYITLFGALAYLVKKFVLPKSLFNSKKSNSKSCGQDDCGCH